MTGRDYTADQLRKGQRSAASAVTAHRLHCADCSRAWKDRQLERCCRDGWRLITELRAASRQLHAHLDAAKAAASRQPTLFDTTEV